MRKPKDFELAPVARAAAWLLWVPIIVAAVMGNFGTALALAVGTTVGLGVGLAELVAERARIATQVSGLRAEAVDMLSLERAAELQRMTDVAQAAVGELYARYERAHREPPEWLHEWAAAAGWTDAELESG